MPLCLHVSRLVLGDAGGARNWLVLLPGKATGSVEVRRSVTFHWIPLCNIGRIYHVRALLV